MISDQDLDREHQKIYSSFTLRCRAMFIDIFVVALVMMAGIAIAIAINIDDITRIIGFSVAGFLLFYEPLLLSLTGSTVGHRFYNIRVVDDRHRGNINFLKAIVRTLTKALLGWLSFLTMATTRRHQAIHDLVTRSTMQIRDPARAERHHYHDERTELVDPNLPSRGRRVLVIVGYLILLALAYMAAFFVSLYSGAITEGCLTTDRCSAGEGILIQAIAWGWFGLCVACIIFGWVGRLPGARRRALASAGQEAG